MAPGDSARSDGGAKAESGKGKTQRRRTSRSKTSKTTIRKSDTKKLGVKKSTAKKGRTKTVSARKTAAQEEKKSKVAEVTVSHETLVRRVKDARGTAFVVLAARTIGGAVVTVLMAGCLMYLLSFVVPLIEWSPVFYVLNVAGAAGLVFAADLASVKSTPEAVSGLALLQDRAFDWVDPFRDEKPHLLPFWLEAILWAPTQILAGAVPFLCVKKTGEADAEAAAGFARRTIEEGEVALGESFQADSSEARGLRLLLLLRLARLVIEDGEVKAKISGLGQTALFEGSVG